ncbi:MAG: prohibitin family protein [Deltaproteobacteria bacterium]|nr:MAG: prohibitin family protein [Deltaproteobacteria bacterium]
MQSTIRFLLVSGFALGASGCTPHSTGSTEVGVRVAKVGLFEPKGVSPEPYPPGATYFFAPVINDFYLYDTALQNLVMSRDAGAGNRYGDDALYFKTIDGNDISVDVTVAWSIDPPKAPYLLQFVGPNTQSVEEKLVRPVSRTLIRDVLNSLASEQFYDAGIRFKKAEEAAALLNHYLNPEGVLISQVLLGEHRFNERYEQIIRDKKVAEQDAARLSSETEAAREQRRRELEQAKGVVNQAMEEARGEAQQKRIEADAIYYQRQREAEAILAEQRAKAKGIAERARALSGAGGRNIVKLKVAEALKGKPIVFVPTGGMDLRTTDMNDLLQTYAVVKGSSGDGGAGGDSSQ